MYRLVVVRHGESLWNRENRFTGWIDIDLSPKGEDEARSAGKILKDEGWEFDVVYTSLLKRAIRTKQILLKELDQLWLPVKRSWRLNERHYGALQGLNKSEMAAKYGEEQVHQWRRGYSVLPPLLDRSDSLHPSRDRRYSGVDESELPSGESLELTVKRFVPVWEREIAQDIRAGKRVLIVAHGNSLRALIQHLENPTPEEIMKLNLPTGIPLVFELSDDLKPLGRKYLGDPETVARAIEAVAGQGKAKK